MVYVPSIELKARDRAPKSPKYKNKKIEFRGLKFDSIGERDRYLFLLSEEDGGRISELRRQVKFALTAHGQHICFYIADFVYMRDGVVIVEDFKGMITDTFSLKAKMFKAQYGYDITIVKRKNWRTTNLHSKGSWK